VKTQYNLGQEIKAQYDWGNLLYAEALAKQDPELPISKEVLARMQDIRDWDKNGKPDGYVDPPSWESMPKFQRAADKIKEHSGGKGVHLLDVGCFTGFFVRQMNEFGHNAHGCDIQPKLMRMLNVRFCNQTNGLRFHAVSSSNIARYFKHGIFDAVTFLDSLEHILDDKMAIQAAMQVLKPGGILIIHVPKGHLYPDDAHEHLRLYDEGSLKELNPGITLEDSEDEKGQPTFFGYKVKPTILEAV